MSASVVACLTQCPADDAHEPGRVVLAVVLPVGRVLGLLQCVHCSHCCLWPKLLALGSQTAEQGTIHVRHNLQEGTTYITNQAQIPDLLFFQMA